MPLIEPVQAAIWDALNHYSFGNAIFLAERLHAEVSNGETLHLLATCYFRAGRPQQAYMLLQKWSCPTPQCKLLMAMCCLQNKKYADAERILVGNLLMKTKGFEEIDTEFGSSACHMYSVLGQIYSKTDRIQKACECYKKSLKLNPLLWKSYEALCELGCKVDPQQVFTMPANMVVPSPSPSVHVPQPTPPNPVHWGGPVSCQPVRPEEAALSVPHTISTASTTPASLQTTVTPRTVCSEWTPENQMQDMKSGDAWAPVRHTKPVKQESPREGSRPNKILFPDSDTSQSPSFGVMNLETSSGLDSNSSALPFISPDPTSILPDDAILNAKAPSKKVVTRRKQPVKPPVFSLSGNSNTRDVSGQPQIGNPPCVRRSSRLFGNSSSVKENKKSQGKLRFTSPKGTGRKSKTRSSKSQQELNELNKSEAGTIANPHGVCSLLPTSAQITHMQQHSIGGLLKLLQGVGKAYAALSQYDCQQSLQLFEDLPEHQYNTAWILSHIARAHFEQGDFQKAVSVFGDVRHLEPYQLLGMDRYSTALWHLQRDVELSALAQDLSQLDNTCPQTWCATGNCFSLQKEHDVAIKFFKRAIQVDPEYAYGYTLLAHEYVFTEELDKALACFRNSLRVDSRHYNAWYGVGMIYYKQEKFNLAEGHFRRALAINPQSSALLCHVGVAEHAQKKTEQALVTLNRAIAQDPNNSLCKFHKASILLACDKLKEALEELEELQRLIPTESLVYFLMGKVHKKLGNTHLALMNFSWAMDLDPKGINNQIKEAIDKRYATDDEDCLVRLTESLPDGGLVELGEERERRRERWRERSSLFQRVLSPEDVHPDLQAIETDESL